MSTKVYDAYRVKEGYTIEDIMSRLKTARKTYHTLIADFLEYVYPRLADRGITNHMKLSDYLKDISLRNLNDICNFNASFMVYFFEERIYLQHFGLNYPIRNTIFQDLFSEITEDYHYQNQTDRWFDYDDDDVERTEEYLAECEKDWEERERIWNGILGDDKKFSEVGLSYEIFCASDCFMVCYELINRDRKDGEENEY